MNKRACIEAILASPLFHTLKKDEAESLCTHTVGLSFPAGKNLAEGSEGMLTLIINGRANVFSPDGERETLIRVMTGGDIFGVAGLFTGAKEVSRVLSATRGSLIRIPKEEILDLLGVNAGFREGYISFLEKRIVFLNKRISAFTAGTAERRVATFLFSVSSEEGYELRGIPFSTLARQLDMGRASFYRALDILRDGGVIEYAQKLITVTSRSELAKRYIKNTEV